MLSLDPEIQERLLGRPVRDILTAVERRAFHGQRVLVTGAGGSIGAELTRQLARCRPAQLTLVDQSEYGLFTIESAIRRSDPDLRVEAVLGDVSRRTDIRAAVATARPHVVYHAAAYKHVTMTERAIIPALRTNVIGTLETVRAAREAGARFVLISSDKAAEPRSVMGASKRIAEFVALGAASPTFRPVAVRFGNILGSSGSLVEIMAQCVREGRNIPITHPEATRFFMTAEEAVLLVMKADLIGHSADVFWLDMGDPLCIGDLVTRFIAAATPAGQPPVGVDIVGLRPGEKMREELTTQGLTMRSTEHPRIWSARQIRIPRGVVVETTRRIRRAVAAGSGPEALAAMHAAVEGFTASPAARAAAHVPQRPAADGVRRVGA